MPQDVITGEAVVLDLRPASFATRVLAYLLDLLLQALVLVGGLCLLFLQFADGSGRGRRRRDWCRRWPSPSWCSCPPDGRR